MLPATGPEVPLAYRAALEGLAEAVREAHALADVLDHFARQLRGARPDPEGLPPEGCPVPSWVRRALERRDRALDEAWRVWEGLPGEAREGLPSPDDLLEEE